MKGKKGRIKTQQARKFRKNPTETEKIMWDLLRDRQLANKKFRRQHLVSGFIIDFYCPENKLAIEIDGSVHLNKKEYDQEREKILKNIGINFLRFSNQDVLKEPKKVLLRIKEQLNPSPFPMEKGVKEKQ